MSDRVLTVADISKRRLLTTAEAAQLAGVCPSTINNWRRLGLLDPVGVTPGIRSRRGLPLYHRRDVRSAAKLSRERKPARKPRPRPKTQPKAPPMPTECINCGSDQDLHVAMCRECLNEIAREHWNLVL